MNPGLKLVVHDFAGHPGQLQLSRELARRGHRVEHQYCASVMTGRGATARRSGDAGSFSVHPVALTKEFARYSPIVRVRQELQYAWATATAVVAARPDVALFANVPIVPLFLVTMTLRLRGIPYVFWWQDVYSEAVGAIARRRLGRVGGLLGWLIGLVERTVAHGAAAIVPITDAFIGPLQAWRVDTTKVHVIPNWGALDEMPSRPRDNAWAREHGLTDVTVVMYAGTLGLKHDPAVIADLASGMRPDVRLVVVSQGKGREWLEGQAGEASGLILLDYQPYERLPDMLATADVLLAVLEQDASRYSVPSKVLNYLCAGRPVLALLPADNAVARIVDAAAAGLVVRPGDTAGATAALDRLLADTELRRGMGHAARRYAEGAFEITAVGALFEEVLQEARDRHLLARRARNRRIRQFFGRICRHQRQ